MSPILRLALSLFLLAFITVKATAQITFESIDVENVSCHGGNDGEITITIAGGTPPFEYMLIRTAPGFAIDVISSPQRTVTFPNLAPVIAGTYLVLAGDGTYSAFMPTSVGQPTQLTANITPDPAQGCTGGNIQLNGNPAGGTGSFTHQWTGPGSVYLSSTTIANPIFNSSVAGSYDLTYTVTDQNNCIATDIITVLNSIPVTNAGADGTTCGLVFTLNATTSFGTGTWTFIGPGTASFSNINNPNATVTVGTPGVYTFTWTETNAGCIDSDDVAVTFFSQPTLTVIPNNPSAPAATDGSIVATISGGTSPYTYTLTDELGNIITSSGPVAATFYLFANLGQESYTVEVVDNNNCSASRSVMLSSAPPLTVDVQSTPACTGNDGTIIIDIVSGQAPFNITLTRVPGGVVHTTTSSNFDFTIPGLSAGNYSISILDGATNTFNTTISVAAGPNASISYTGSPFCRIGTATVTQTGQGGGSYSAIPGGLAIDPNTGTINLAASNSGTYTVTYSFTDGVCFGSTQTTVVVGDLGTVTISYTQPVFCAQGTATPTITGLPLQFTERIFTGGHIPTDGLFDLSQAFSRCPGQMAVTIPIGAVITGVDVEYTMRAHGSINAWIADQRSQLRVTNPGGLSEPVITRGPNIVTTGTHTYVRNNLNIANGVVGGGAINFELHAGRVRSFPPSTDCLTNRQRVDNNTWRVRVYHTGVHNFSALPAGLVIDPITGVVDLAASTPGTYTVYFEYGDGTCTGIATTQITVVALPTATISYQDTPYCAVGTATVTRTGQSGGIYTSTTGLVINPLTGEINLETSTPGSYTVTYTFTNGTCQNTTTAQIVINPLPQASITYAGSPFCATGTANVTLTGQTGGTFSAAPAGLSINATTGAINLATSTPGIYTVTYIFNNGVCDNLTTTTVEILALPIASISYDLSPYCAFGIATVSRTGQTGGTFSSTPGLLINTATGDINLTGSTPGTYTVTYTFSNGTCTSTTTTLVTINALPVASISYPGSPFCNIGTAPVTRTGQSGGIYSSTPVGLSIDPATGTISLAASLPGTYTVLYEFSDGTCNNETSTTVVVNASPTATISYPGSPYCAVGFADVTITGQTGGTFSSTAGLVINTATGQVNLTASTPGIYTVTYTFSNGLCTNQTTAQITINPLPVATILYSGSPFCPVGIGVVTRTGPTGGTYSSTAGLEIDPASGAIDLEASTPGTYTITYNFTDGTCSSSATTVITIRSLPTATISYDNTTLCATGVANATITGQTGGTFSAAPAGLSLNTVTGQINLETSTPGLYTITYSFTDGFCSNSTTTILEIAALPTATILYDDVYFCAFEYADVVLTGQTGGTFTSTAGLVIDAATGRVDLEASQSGTYTVTYEFSNGVCTNFTTAEITLRALPQAQISYGGSPLCAAGTALVTITGQGGGIFNAYPVGLEVDLITGTIDLSASIPGTYTVYYRFDDGYCENITSITVIVNEAPLLLLGGSTNVLCAGEASGTITVEAIDGLLPYTFELLDADETTILQSHIITTPGSFTFTNVPPGLFFVRVTDANICGSSTIGPVLIDEPDSITIDPALIVISNESCPGLNDGSVSILAQGGTGNLYYSILREGIVIAGPQTNNGTFTNLAPGNYTIRIIDDNGCQTEMFATITSPPPAFAGDDQTICLGSQAIIGVEIIIPDPAITFEWTSQPNDLSISDSTVSNPTVSPAETTTYILTQTNTLSGCVSRDTVVVSVIGAIPSAGEDQTICAGTFIILGPQNPIAGNSFTWTSSNPAEVFDFNVPNPSVAPLIITTYILTEVFTTFGCINTDTIVVTVNPLPMAETGPDLFICPGDTVTLGTVYTGPIPINTYLWTSVPFDPSISDSTISNPTVSPLQTTTYTLEETSLATGCITTRSVVVTVRELPLALVASDTTVCAYSPINLGSDLAADTLRYLWRSEPAGFTSTEKNPIVIPGEYTLDANSQITFFLEVRTQYCMAENQVTLTIIEAPEVRIADDMIFCSAADASNQQIGGEAIDGYTYVWQSNMDAEFSSTDANPVVSPIVTTTYTLTVTNTVTGCTAVDSVIISISDLAFDMPSDLTICLGGQAIIGVEVINPDPAITFEWTSQPNDLSISDSTVSNPTVSPTETTTYILTQTNTLSGCVSRDTVVVSVVGAIPSAGPDQTTCAGTIVILGPQNPIAGNSFTWTSSNPAEVFDFNVPNPSVTPLITTTYILTEVFTAFGCINTDTIVVTVNPAPLAETGPDLFICPGDTVTLGTVYTIPMPINTYRWTSVPFDPSISDSIISNPTVSPLQTTTYTLEETFLATGCVTTRSVVVTVRELPLALVASDTTVCAYSPINLGSDLAVDTLSYLWRSEPAGFTSTEKNPIVIPGEYTLDVNNQITFFLEVRTQYCMAENQVTLTVIEAPEVRIANDSIFCSAADAINLQIGGEAIDGYTYVWQSNRDDGFSSTDANPAVSPLVTTTYTLTVTNTTTGCSAIDSVTISISDLALVMPSTIEICEGETSVVLGENTVVTGGMLPYQYLWTDADGISVANTLDTTLTAPFSEFYTLTITDALNCAVSGEVQINVIPSPRVYLTANGDSIQGTVTMYLGQSIIFQAFPDTLQLYDFYIVDAPLNGGEAEPIPTGRLVQSGSSNIFIASDLKLGDQVYVIAFDGTCSGESPWVTVALNELPNAFTPDGDGINDIFAPGMEITIFNRWGQTIYEGTSESAGWDGTYNGRNVSPGTYFYLLNIYDANNRVTTFKGSVAVIRGDLR